ncbi:MAG: rRNA maturation RNase YbeY [Candidatus Binatia bacterium]
MAVTVSGAARRPRLDRRRIARRAQIVLETIGRSGAELSIVLVGDAAMRRLNRDYRGKDRPTDVLAFSLLEGPGAGLSDAIGDVVISTATAVRQARENGLRLREEVDRLLVHGILHLVGYDHERSPAEARRMRRKELVCLKALEPPAR